jgi:hypothetical protein
VSGRRCRALRKKFREETGRPAIRREQRWLKGFYQQHKTMAFGLKRVAPVMMSLWERAERLGVDPTPVEQEQTLTEVDQTPTMNTGEV